MEYVAQKWRNAKLIWLPTKGSIVGKRRADSPLSTSPSRSPEVFMSAVWLKSPARFSLSENSSKLIDLVEQIDGDLAQKMSAIAESNSLKPLAWRSIRLSRVVSQARIFLKIAEHYATSTGVYRAKESRQARRFNTLRIALVLVLFERLIHRLYPCTCNRQVNFIQFARLYVQMFTEAECQIIAFDLSSTDRQNCYD